MRQDGCNRSLWDSEDREQCLFIDTAVDCYWMLASTKVSEKQRARTGEYSPYSLLLSLMDRKLQTGAAMFCLCLLHTKEPWRQFESWTEETRNQNPFQTISHSNTMLESLTTYWLLYSHFYYVLLFGQNSSLILPLSVVSAGLFTHCTSVSGVFASPVWVYSKFCLKKCKKKYGTFIV